MWLERTVAPPPLPRRTSMRPGAPQAIEGVADDGAADAEVLGEVDVARQAGPSGAAPPQAIDQRHAYLVGRARQLDGGEGVAGTGRRRLTTREPRP
jgi:hypothetical protein